MNLIAMEANQPADRSPSTGYCTHVGCGRNLHGAVPFCPFCGQSQQTANASAQRLADPPLQRPTEVPLRNRSPLPDERRAPGRSEVRLPPGQYDQTPPPVIPERPAESRPAWKPLPRPILLMLPIAAIGLWGYNLYYLRMAESSEASSVAPATGTAPICRALAGDHDVRTVYAMEDIRFRQTASIQGSAPLGRMRRGDQASVRWEKVDPDGQCWFRIAIGTGEGRFLLGQSLSLTQRPPLEIAMDDYAPAMATSPIYAEPSKESAELAFKAFANSNIHVVGALRSGWWEISEAGEIGYLPPEIIRR